MRLAVKDVLAEHSDDFGVGVGIEMVASLDENVLELFVCLSQSCIRELSLELYLQLVMIPSSNVSAIIEG